MKIRTYTFNLAGTDIEKLGPVLESLMELLSESGSHSTKRIGGLPEEVVDHPLQMEREPLPSFGVYENPDAPPDADAAQLSIGEAVLREIVDLWLDPEMESVSKAEQIQRIGNVPHTASPLLSFVDHLGTLSHGVDYVRVKFGHPKEDWNHTEEIAMNLTQIASIVFPRLAATYNELFKMERADPERFEAYRRSIDVK